MLAVAVPNKDRIHLAIPVSFDMIEGVGEASEENGPDEVFLEKYQSNC